MFEDSVQQQNQETKQDSPDLSILQKTYLFSENYCFKINTISNKTPERTEIHLVLALTCWMNINNSFL